MSGRQEFLRDQLTLLRDHGQSVNWSASPKGFLAFVRELRAGESKLRYVSPFDAWIHRVPRGLLREVSAVNVHVFHKRADGQMEELVEAMQVFNNGETRRRGYQWVSEKIEGNEPPVKAAYRGVLEELFSEKPTEAPPLERLRRKKRKRVNEPSTTYPGMHSSKIIHDFSLVLTDEEYMANMVTLPSGETVYGFKEEQLGRPDGKTTYFVWQLKRNNTRK